ncbi:dephospho-CoA kinase [bacterium]|nr:dephospho-CoA kinase [bacterium]
MYILGVTGNIGSGKTTVARRLGDHGAVVSHSDELAKEILQNDAGILDQLCQRFGSDIIDNSGRLKRHILAERAFSSPESQQFLNQLIHPEVRKVTLSRIAQAHQGNKNLFVIDAPLLFEAGVDAICTSVAVIAADNIYRQDRVEKRSQILEDDFTRRDGLQMSMEEKMERADHLIFNNGSLEDLLLQVDLFYKGLKL